MKCKILIVHRIHKELNRKQMWIWQLRNDFIKVTIKSQLTFKSSIATLKFPICVSCNRSVAASTKGLNTLCIFMAMPIVFTSLFISTMMTDRYFIWKTIECSTEKLFCCWKFRSLFSPLKYCVKFFYCWFFFLLVFCLNFITVVLCCLVGWLFFFCFNVIYYYLIFI